MEILKNLILNISFLIVVAQILTGSKLIRNMIYERSLGKQKVLRQLGLGVLFGLISSVSTHMGVETGGSIVNMRVTGVLASGIIGGPVVGSVTAVIAATHRYLLGRGVVTALACAVSTLLEGMIGIGAYLYLKERRWKREQLFFLGMAAGVMQAVMILLLGRPFPQAVQVVQLIALPMSCFNALGLVLFVSTFHAILIDRDMAVAEGIRLVMDISGQCLGLFRKGMGKPKVLQQVTQILVDKTDFSAAAIYDREQLLAFQSPVALAGQPDGGVLPAIVQWVFEHQKSRMMDSVRKSDPFAAMMAENVVLAAPLMQGDGIKGVLVVFVSKHRFSYRTDVDFLNGLAKIFSAQLELAEADIQKRLRQKAEFQALQAQINPHFLFNALNTITAFCREKPERARELLITLSTYFRNTLNTHDYMVNIDREIDHIKTYLELEKARFEERLEIILEVEAGLFCQMPGFILQPLVENAVKHGAMKRANGVVRLLVKAKSHEVVIRIEDNGYGIPGEIISRLYEGTMAKEQVGLCNVHHRLLNVYGKKSGLQIRRLEQGTAVLIRIPYYPPVRREGHLWTEQQPQHG